MVEVREGAMVMVMEDELEVAGRKRCDNGG
jgi:hypothetical protein